MGNLEDRYTFDRGRRAFSIIARAREEECQRIKDILWPLHGELRETWVPNLNCFNVNIAMEDDDNLIRSFSVDAGVFISIKMQKGDVPTAELVEFVESKIGRRLSYRSHDDPYTSFQVLF